MKRTISQKQLNTVLFILSALIFLYVFIRACVLSITWDEAYSYIEFVRNGIVVLDKYEGMSANNHILNTALMIFFTKAFGLSELVLRIPSLIALFFFLFYAIKFVKHIDNKLVAVAAFIILTVNPYLLDFFCLARGYGLSIGLMMCSLYYFYLLHIRSKKNTNAILSVLLAFLAVLANFVLLNYCIVLFGLIVALYVYTALKPGDPARTKLLTVAKGLFIPVVLMLLLFVFVVPIAVKLKGAGALFFGGNRGFWADTISTVTDRCFYELGYSYWLQRLSKGCMFLVLAAASALVMVRLSRKQLSGNALFLLSLLLLLGLCSLSTIVQHELMGTLFLLDRTALFLVVLFNLVFVFFVAEAGKAWKQAAIPAHVAAGLLILHFCLSANFSYVLEWKPDANTKEMLADLEKIRVTPEGKETVSIGIPLVFDPAINFYRDKNNLTWLNTAWRYKTTDMRQDYFFLSPKELSTMNKDSIEVLKTYPGTEHVLAKPKYPPKAIRAAYTRKMTFENEPQKQFVIDEKVEYGPAFSYIVNDSITPGKQAVVAFYAEVSAPDLQADNLIMVISFQTAAGDLYSWQKAYVKDFIRKPGQGYRASFTCIVPSEIRSRDEIKAYIWNPEKHKLLVDKMQFQWLEYMY